MKKKMMKKKTIDKDNKEKEKIVKNIEEEDF